MGRTHIEKHGRIKLRLEDYLNDVEFYFVIISIFVFIVNVMEMFADDIKCQAGIKGSLSNWYQQ